MENYDCCGKSTSEAPRMKGMKCRHLVCKRCCEKVKECYACHVESVNKILVPMMYHLYDIHALQSGVKNRELLFSDKEIDFLSYDKKDLEVMIESSWRIDTFDKLKRYIDAYESFIKGRTTPIS